MTTTAENSPVSAGEEATEAEVNQSYVERRAAELRESRKESKVEAPGALPPIQESEPTIPEPKDEEAKPEEAEPEKPEAEEEESKAEEADTDGALDLSQIDYEQLDADSAEELGRQLSDLLGSNIAAFAKGTGSGLGKDMGELRAKMREAEAEKEKVAASLEKLAPNSNRFSDVKDDSKLDEIESNLVALYDSYSSKAIRGDWEVNDEGDEGVFDQGKFYPKEQMLQFLDNWKSDLREIPKQRNHLLKSKESRKQRDKVAKKLADSHDWFGDPESKESKEYSELMGDPSVVGAVRLFPDLESTLMEAFAAKVGGKKPAGKITLPLRSKSQPASGDNGAVASGKPRDKDLAEAERRVQSGQFTATDYAKARSAKYKDFFKKT